MIHLIMTLQMILHDTYFPKFPNPHADQLELTLIATQEISAAQLIRRRNCCETFCMRPDRTVCFANTISNHS